MRDLTTDRLGDDRRTTVQCPNCGARVEWSTRSPHRPFCSERCRLIDLGAWVEGERYIPGEPSLDTWRPGDGEDTDE